MDLMGLVEPSAIRWSRPRSVVPSVKASVRHDPPFVDRWTVGPVGRWFQDAYEL